jgi:hypothetical protein
MDCDHEYLDGKSAIEEVMFYEEDEDGKKHLKIDYLICALCGKRFIAGD